jgi:hypothetical protein
MAGQQYIGTGRLGAHQSIAFTGTAGTIANAIGTGVTKVRVVVTSAAYIKIDNNPPATTADVYLPADRPEYFSITPGQRVSAVQVSTGGTLHVTEIV